MRISPFNNDWLIESEDYEKVMNETVLPELSKTEERRIVHADHDCGIFCRLYRSQNASGTVVIVHGFTENSEKYSELTFSLLKNHFNVISYDQRGHGYSWRDPESQISVTHVDHFEEYVSDLNLVCTEVLKDFPEPWFIFSHSMGGAVTALYLERFPHAFSKAVFCAPMIAPNHSFIPLTAAKGICQTAAFLGQSKKRVFFLKPYQGPEDFNTSNATDFHRFSWYDSVKASHREYHNSCPTYSWTNESLSVTKQILKKGEPEKIRIPVLIFTAENDSSVLPGAQQKFADMLPNAKIIFVDHAKHEIYRSVNSVLFPWWHRILDFIKEA